MEVWQPNNVKATNAAATCCLPPCARQSDMVPASLNSHHLPWLLLIKSTSITISITAHHNHTGHRHTAPTSIHYYSLVSCLLLVFVLVCGWSETPTHSLFCSVLCLHYSIPHCPPQPPNPFSSLSLALLLLPSSPPRLHFLLSQITGHC